MSKQKVQYDAAIVGASIAGTAAAMLFARQGLRVALIEREKDINAYKKVCTHYIQPDATPTLQRLGLAEAIEAAGGVRNGGRAWTRWGWVGSGVSDSSYGYNIRRQVLDPLLRRRAAATPGVDFRPGLSLRELIYDGDRIVGLRARGSGQEEVEIRARLVIGADGRYSRTAELAGLPAHEYANDRFSYFAYFRHLPLATGQSAQIWYLEPDVAYALPNDNGLTLLALMPARAKLEEFKRDVPGNFVEFFEKLPNGPKIRAAEQATEVRGMLNMPNLSRPTTAPGLALIGDAALTSDPVWGNGIGWALQSAEWLADAAAEALREGDESELDGALARYSRRHRSVLAGRFARDVDFSQARPFNLLERLMYSAAARQPGMGRYVGPYSMRLANIRHYPPLKAIGWALWINLAHWVRPHLALPVPSPARTWQRLLKEFPLRLGRSHRPGGA